MPVLPHLTTGRTDAGHLRWPRRRLLRVRAGVLTVALLPMTWLMVVPAEATTTTTTTTIAATADATVLSGAPATNSGSDTTLVADSSPNTESVVRFDVTGDAGEVTKAVLRLYVRDATVDGPKVHAVESGWDESTVTWNTKPARTGGAVPDTGALAANTWAEYDVTPLVTSRGTYSFALVPDSSDQVVLTSRNSTATTQRPHLVVTVDDSAPSTSLDSAPPAKSTSRDATFAFSSSDVAATFECSLEAAAFEPCQSPKSYSELIDGGHAFQVRAVKAGVVDPTPATHSWTVDATAPTVTSTAPTQGAVNVPVSDVVTATFSEPLDPATVGPTSFKLTAQGGTTAVPATVAYDDASRTAKLDPDTALAAGTTYIATLPAGAVKDQMGNSLAEDVSWSFTVAAADKTAPEVVDRAPVEGATGVAVSSSVTATFSESMSVDSVTAESFRLTAADGSAVAATVTYDAASKKALLDPVSDLAFSTTFTASLPTGATGVKDTSGNSLATTQAWSFTTLSDSVQGVVQADSSVFSATPTTNHGGATTLQADSSPNGESLLRFDVSGGTGAVTSAKLRLYVRDATNDGPKLYAADNAWDELTVTWNNKPARSGGVVADATALAANTWAEYDVTSLVTSRGVFTFALVPDSVDQVAFTSRNSTATSQRPQLLVGVNAAVPGTRLDSAPAAVTTSSSAAFTFSSTDSAATFDCAVDGAAFESCTSPKEYQGLSNGSHAFQVRARNGEVVDPTPATHTWTIDTAAPSVTGVSPTKDASAVPASTNVTVAFSEAMDAASVLSALTLTAEGATSPVGAVVTYDAEAQSATLNPNSDLAEGVVYTGRMDGAARDVAGNALGTTTSWTFRTATSASSTVTAAADATVDSGQPSTNLGSATTLKVDSSPQLESVLRFVVTGYPAGLTQATVRLYVTDGTDNGPGLYSAGGTWEESSVTWATKPSRGSLVSNYGSMSNGTYVDYDVLSLVRGDGTYDLALVGESSNSVSFAAREATSSRRPQLLLAYNPAAITIAASPTSGTYTSRQSVTLSASEASTIWFTTDGTDPSDVGSHTRHQYSAPLDIAVTTPLRFVAVASDGRMSGVRTENYTIDVTTGFRDFYYGGTGVTEATADKTENKLWQHAGSWWGSLYSNSTGEYRIHRFDGQGWVDTGTTIDTREDSRADVLTAGDTLYVLTGTTVVSEFGSVPSAADLAAGSGDLVRYTYDAGSGRYVRDPGFPVTVRPGSSESMTLDKDSTGRLWITFTRDSKVWVNHSLSKDTEWGVPFVPAIAGVAVHHDDISAVVRFGSDSIGLMWSNQAEKRFYFAVHRDADAGNVWQASELAHGGGVAGCGTTSNGGTGCANDHLNVRATSDGRVFAAIKTANRTTGQPLVRLVVRTPGAGWTGYTSSLVEDEQSRPRVLIDEGQGKLYLLATKPELGAAIFYKETSLHDIRFERGVGASLIQSPADRMINNATSAKQNTSGGFMVLASDSNSKYYLHSFVGR